MRLLYKEACNTAQTWHINDGLQNHEFWLGAWLVDPKRRSSVEKEARFHSYKMAGEFLRLEIAFVAMCFLL